VNLTDVYATVADLANADHSAALDSVSMVPYLEDPEHASIREWVYSQSFAPSGLFTIVITQRRTARNERFKLITYYLNAPTITSIELYDLAADPFEQNDLLLGTLTPEQQVNFDFLAAAMQQLQPW
jgi:arylsulfatase A-like enzyme